MYTVEPVLLTTVRITTFDQQNILTNATGFFFKRDERLYLVSSRHVFYDDPSNHYPDHIEIELHSNESNLAESVNYLIPLYNNGNSLWRQGVDNAGKIDVAVIEIDLNALPEKTAYRAFTPEHLLPAGKQARVGTQILIIGFPLGFHDNLHHMPIVRDAVIASSFGLRFQGQGFFLTDARTHRGISGAPVVMSIAEPGSDGGDIPWSLLGIHSARLDVGTRDLELDEVLGLNCSWYADILLTLTDN